MRQTEISGASRKQYILFVLSFAALSLSIVSFVAIYFHIFMFFISAILAMAYVLLRRATANVELTEIRCQKCGWLRRS